MVALIPDNWGWSTDLPSCLSVACTLGYEKSTRRWNLLSFILHFPLRRPWDPQASLAAPGSWVLKAGRLHLSPHLRIPGSLQSYFSVKHLAVSSFLPSLTLPIRHEKCSVLQWCLTLCDPADSGPPDTSVRGILRGRMLEWVVMPSPRDWTHVSYFSCTGRQILYHQRHLGTCHICSSYPKIIVWIIGPGLLSPVL